MKMDLFIELAAVVVLAGVLLLMVPAVKTALLLPVCGSENVAIVSLIKAKGDASELEQTVRTLVGLRDSGRLRAEIVIIDDGMSDQAKCVALMLENDHSCVKLSRKDTEETECTRMQDT